MKSYTPPTAILITSPRKGKPVLGFTLGFVVDFLGSFIPSTICSYIFATTSPDITAATTIEQFWEKYGASSHFHIAILASLISSFLAGYACAKIGKYKTIAPGLILAFSISAIALYLSANKIPLGTNIGISLATFISILIGYATGARR